jgi:putative drug exporter of the RND superfamily
MARFAARRRWLVVAFWAAGLLVVGLLVRQAGGAYVDNFTLPGAPSQQAQDVLRQRFPAQAGDTAILVAYAPAGIQSPTTGSRFQQLLEQARRLPNVTSVSPPLPSRDGRYAYVVLQYDRQAAALPDSSVQTLERLADGSGGSGLTVEVGGNVVSAHEGSGHDP